MPDERHTTPVREAGQRATKCRASGTVPIFVWWAIDMATSAFHLVGSVSSDSPTAIEPVLRRLVDGTVSKTPDGFEVDGWWEGTDPRELNRDLLTALRRVERRTRLRSEWTADGVTHRFFDYVPKGSRPASPGRSGS